MASVASASAVVINLGCRSARCSAVGDKPAANVARAEEVMLRLLVALASAAFAAATAAAVSSADDGATKRRMGSSKVDGVDVQAAAAMALQQYLRRVEQHGSCCISTFEIFTGRTSESLLTYCE